MHAIKVVELAWCSSDLRLVLTSLGIAWLRHEWADWTCPLYKTRKKAASSSNVTSQLMELWSLMPPGICFKNLPSKPAGKHTAVFVAVPSVTGQNNATESLL